MVLRFYFRYFLGSCGLWVYRCRYRFSRNLGTVQVEPGKRKPHLIIMKELPRIMLSFRARKSHFYVFQSKKIVFDWKASDWPRNDLTTVKSVYNDYHWYPPKIWFVFQGIQSGFSKIHWRPLILITVNVINRLSLSRWPH